MDQFLVCRLGSQDYGIHIKHVESVEPLYPVTRVPATAPFVKGLINLRGVVVPVIDLNGFFGLPDTVATDETRIVIVAAGDIVAGLMVDSTDDVVEIEDGIIQSSPDVLTGVDADYLCGVAPLDRGTVAILNLDKVLDPRAAVR